MERMLVDAEIYHLKTPKEVWPLFAPHHYLNASFRLKANGFLVVLGDDPIAFTSSTRLVSGVESMRYGVYREYRTVVLPDYQGMGLGSRLAEWLGEWHLAQGQRFYSRTTHPRLGQIRGDKENPNLRWRPTVANKRQRLEKWDQKMEEKYAKEGKKRSLVGDRDRIATSHEYVGHPLEARRRPSVAESDQVG